MATTETKNSDELKTRLVELEHHSQNLGAEGPATAQSPQDAQADRLWIHELHVLLTKIERLMQDVIVEEHLGLYKQIRRENTELLRRVEQLQENDQHVLADNRRLLEWCEQWMDGGTEQAEEGEASQPRNSGDISKAALVFAGACRQHLEEVTHWFLEAFHRDRGVVD